MKIVYFIDHLQADGTQHVLKQLVQGLAARGHHQVVVSLSERRDDLLVADLLMAGRVRVIGKLPLILGYGFAATWLWLRREKFDVAVTLLFVADFLARPLAHISGIPRTVTSLRARNTNYPKWKRWLARSTMRWADAVIINSRSVRDFAVAEEGAQANHIHYIPNAVKVEDYAEPLDRAALRAEFGLPGTRTLVAGIGRLTRQKGFDLLLRAFSRLPARDVDLLVIGIGDEASRLREQTASLGLADRVHFAGYRRDVPRLLGALDLYVHPARFEGMPNTVLEAMAACCPVVAFGIDGVNELLADGEHGWVVPPGDAQALALAMQAALGNPAEARRRAAAAHARVARDFGVEAMVIAWEHVLRGRSEAS